MPKLTPGAVHQLVVGFASSVDMVAAIDAVALDQQISRSALIRRLMAKGAEVEGLNLPIRV